MNQKSGVDPPTETSPISSEAHNEMGRHLVGDGPLSGKAHESLSVCKPGEFESRGSSKEQMAKAKRSLGGWIAVIAGVAVDVYDIVGSLGRAAVFGILAIGTYLLQDPAIATALALVCAAEMAVAGRVIWRQMHEEPFSAWIHI